MFGLLFTVLLASCIPLGFVWSLQRDMEKAGKTHSVIFIQFVLNRVYKVILGLILLTILCKIFHI